jgi:hypothetical protein
MSPPTDTVSDLAWSSSADFIAASSWDNQVGLWRRDFVEEREEFSTTRSFALKCQIALLDVIDENMGGGTERAIDAKGRDSARGAGVMLSLVQGAEALLLVYLGPSELTT